MSDYYWEKIVMLLLDRIERMEAQESEFNHRIDELMTENIRLHQIMNEREEGAK